MLLEEKGLANSIPAQLPGKLAQRLSQHLLDEQSALTAMLESVRSLHRSLRHLSGEDLGRSLESEAISLQAAQAIQKTRQELRFEIAIALDVPSEQLTLTVLAEKTSGQLHDLIVESRDRLFEMSTELNVLNRQNAAMIHQSLMLIRGVVERLTKTVGVGESYNAGGVKEDARVGSLLEWGG